MLDFPSFFFPLSFFFFLDASLVGNWKKKGKFWLGHLKKAYSSGSSKPVGHLAYFQVKITEHPRTMVGILQHWNIPVVLSRSWVIDNPSVRLLATLTLIKHTVCKPYNWPKCHKPHNQESLGSYSLCVVYRPCEAAKLSCPGFVEGPSPKDFCFNLSLHSLNWRLNNRLILALRTELHTYAYCKHFMVSLVFYRLKWQT